MLIRLAHGRWLADFEEDRHKKCVLQKARAKRVEAVLQAVSREKNPQAYRTLQLDIGNAYREITEIKFEDARPFEKVGLHGKNSNSLMSPDESMILNS